MKKRDKKSSLQDKAVLFENFRIALSKKSVRKYPHVIWFPRSKTDPREIREVLKLALIAEEDSQGKVFNDKILGEKMAHVGSINVVGLDGKRYIESYKGKSTGNISYITNARMIMRLLRFLGLVSRVSKGEYKVTELGKLYTKFSGDFPSNFMGESEEAILLQSLSDFGLYSVNDDSIYRDPNFKMRPFIWLLYSISIEPQCIFQLIVTTFASKAEDKNEISRIKTILRELREGKTTLSEEWKKVRLDPDDYSCVHNFYDSAKILVYLGTSLGLITKFADPGYGKKIAGKAKYLKQATVFYRLTEKGSSYLKNVLDRPPIYYEDLYKTFGDKGVLQAAFVLAALNFQIGNSTVSSIEMTYLSRVLDISLKELDTLVEALNKKIAKINLNNSYLSLKKTITFNFWQSIPPEILILPKFNKWFENFMQKISEKDVVIKVVSNFHKNKFEGEINSKFILNKEKNIYYSAPKLDSEQTKDAAYVKYGGMEEIYGGSDRFPSRISPTNSVVLVGDKVHIDNEKDTLDLLIPLRHPDEPLKEFIRNNTDALVHNFMDKSSEWEKDQHYLWVRNCFRLFGAEAIFSGSGGMLSRADVSVLAPFLAGIEIKSPRENRGTINTKAIRQAVDAKIQVADAYPGKKKLPRIAIAIGRRVSPLAIKEEKKWAKEGHPILLINDVILYYLCLKTVDIRFTLEDILSFFINKRGVIDKSMLWEFLSAILERQKSSEKLKDKIKNEVDNLTPFLTIED